MIISEEPLKIDVSGPYIKIISVNNFLSDLDVIIDTGSPASFIKRETYDKRMKNNSSGL